MSCIKMCENFASVKNIKIRPKNKNSIFFLQNFNCKVSFVNFKRDKEIIPVLAEFYKKIIIFGQ